MNIDRNTLEIWKRRLEMAVENPGPVQWKYAKMVHDEIKACLDFDQMPVRCQRLDCLNPAVKGSYLCSEHIEAGL